MSFGSRLKEQRDRLGLTQTELGDLLGITGSAIGNYENGISSPKADILYRVFDILQCDANYLFQDEMRTFRLNKATPDEMSKIIAKYRLLDDHGQDMVLTVLNKEYDRVGSLENISKEYAPLRRLKYYESPVSAGTGEYLDNAYNRTIEVPLTPETKRADFVVRVSGDSMEPDFFDGDELLVEAAPAIDENELGIFIVNDEGLFKKQGVGRLISLNKNYADIRLHDYDSVYCRGRVIGKL